MKRLVTLFLILMLLCGTAMADNGTVITMDTTNVPEIPEGTLSAEVIPFTGNQTYAVFSAPTKKSIRGAKGRARVSTNDWIQVFGAEDDWILVQYDISDKHICGGRSKRESLRWQIICASISGPGCKRSGSWAWESTR